MKLKNKINVYFLVALISVLFVAGVIFVVAGNQILKNQAFEEIKNINAAKAFHVRTFLKSEKEVVSSFAASTVFRDLLKLSPSDKNYLLEKERSEKRLDRSIVLMDEIQELFVLDKNGFVLISSDRAQEGNDKSTNTYFLEGKNKVFITNFYFSSVIKKNTYAVSSPILDDETGELLGVVVARMKPDNLDNLMKGSVALRETGEIFLVNRDKFFLTSSRFLGPDAVLVQKADMVNTRGCFSPEEVVLVVKSDISGENFIDAVHQNFVTFTDYRNKTVVGTHSYIPEADWCLVTKIDLSEVVAPNYLLLFLALFLLIVSVFVFVFVGSVLSKKIVAPIIYLSSAIETMLKTGYFNIKVNTSSQDEIGVLSRNFEKMANAVTESRASIEKKVEEQTREIASKAKDLEIQKNTLLNTLLDMKKEKIRSDFLAKDLAKFKLAVDSTAEHVIITDPEGVTLYGNHAAETITGYSLSEMMGKKAGMLWHLPMPKELYEEMWRVIKMEKKVYHGQLQNRRKNGEIYDADVQISPVLDEDGKLIFLVGVERDITKQKQMDQAKTNFVSLTSHLLRTPVTAVRLFAEILADEKVGTMNDVQKEYLKDLSSAVRRMVQVINDLLNVSRIESNRLEIYPEAVQIEDIIQSTLDTFCREDNCGVCEMQFKKPEEKSPMVLVDTALMKEILYKIFNNSRMYIREKVKCEIAVSLEYNENGFEITVVDNGMGIPLKDHKKIFEKFFRSDNISKIQTTGSGLGLYIVKNILDGAGCGIRFESQEGIGTTFFITIPNTGMKKRIGSVGIEKDI
jgi:PAS domain S-box-containing protein